MSKFDKLIKEIKNLSADMRFSELKKVLESYGYLGKSPKGGSSHWTFRKDGRNPITIPYKRPIKVTYVKLVRDIVESEERKE
ncbi:toxin HicA [Clostridium tyrobutyricum]|uniref:toxin HicA n=1 Tax=Clostridium tyrobutyricum TaxID=1519 RepID=UPI00189FE127|nr:toxin HicA [Clostridium tyrobutyricum]